MCRHKVDKQCAPQKKGAQLLKKNANNGNSATTVAKNCNRGSNQHTQTPYTNTYMVPESMAALFVFIKTFLL